MQLDFFEDVNFNDKLDVNGTNQTGFNITRVAFLEMSMQQ